jgi:hypothetical protein
MSLKSAQSRFEGAATPLDGFAAATPSRPRQRCPGGPYRPLSIITVASLPSFLPWWPCIVRALGLAPSGTSALAKQNLGYLAGGARPRLQRLVAIDPLPPKICHPSGTEWPQPGSTAATLASCAMTLLPNPVKPTVSAREALRNCPGEALSIVMAAMNIACLLYHDLVEPIAGRGWPCWRPRRLL